MDHLSSVHNRTVVDNDVNFYKCCFCMKGFSSQNRRGFLEHLDSHQIVKSYCYDCNTNTESNNLYDSHRERCHHDFSGIVVTDNEKSAPKNAQTQKPPNTIRQINADVSLQQTQVTAAASPKQLQYELVNNATPNIQQQPTQQIVLEDGSLLNMNNLILTENGEFIIQNIDGLLPNGQESDEGTQIQISNLEQFLMEQGLAGNAEISYIQPDMDGQVLIQNSSETPPQDTLMQSYKGIFEPNDEIPNELIGETEVETEQPSQNILLNGEYLIETSQKAMGGNNIQHSIEHIDVTNSQQQQQALDAANQSTLDELGDILVSRKIS
jgi:hypothetical protein